MTKSFIGDTNLWIRYVDSDSPQLLIAAEALEIMTAKGRLMLIPQNLAEFWVVATRPKEANGLGWTAGQASSRLAELLARYEFKPDSPELTDRWLAVVRDRSVLGKRAHDARIAAAVLTTHVNYLVTFNTTDFLALPINVLHPKDVAAVLSAG